jgi:excisionase family DNA binding protein
MRPLLHALLAEIQDDEAAKRELADALRPYLMRTQGDERPERLLTTKDKAGQLGVHPDTLVRMAREERIWAEKVGREWRFRSDDVPRSGPRIMDHVGTALNARRQRTKTRASVTAIRGQ